MRIPRDGLFEEFERQIEKRFRTSGGVTIGGRQHSHCTVEAIWEFMFDDPHAARIIFDAGVCAALAYIRSIADHSMKDPQ